MPEDEIQDVLFFADARPVFLRFRIRVAGDGFRTAWGDFVARLHRFLDGDGDGVLTPQEAQRGNWQQLLQSPFGPPLATPASTAGPTGLDSQPKDGQVSVDELTNHLRSALGFGEFGVQPGPPPDPRAQAIFAHLDLDHDGKLSPADLAATDGCLDKLDLDEDELISLAEMRPFQNLYADQFRPISVPVTNPEADTGPFVPLGPGAAPPRLVQRLLGKYDRGAPDVPKDGKLNLAELGIDPEAFRRLDDDGDGGLVPCQRNIDRLSRQLSEEGQQDTLQRESSPRPLHSTCQNSLDSRRIHLNSDKLLSRATHRFSVGQALGARELAALLRQPPPDLALNTALGPVGQAGAKIAMDGPPRHPIALATRAEAKAGTSPLRIVMEGVEVELLIKDTINDTRNIYKQQFNNADADKNGYVDKPESERNGFFQQIFPAADRDGDGKLFAKELEAYVDRQSDAIGSRILLTISDRGRALFEILDADGDQKLGRRELRRARERLAVVDRDGDSRVALNEIPHHYRLGVGRGQASLRRGLSVASYNAPEPPGRQDGPPWFEKMDRNRDGDVSPREFLGPRADFRRFDADGDGLIDPREATQAP